MQTGEGGVGRRIEKKERKQEKGCRLEKEEKGEGRRRKKGDRRDGGEFC
jgi:hypothetical protein